MNFPLNLGAPDQLFPALQKLSVATARTRNMGRVRKMICLLLASTWPFAAAYAQSASSSQRFSSSSQQSSSSQPAPAQTQPQSQAQPATPDQPPQAQDSLAEAARKAPSKKQAAEKGKVFTEDDLPGIKGTGVSVVGEASSEGTGRAKPTDPDGADKPNGEEYWRGRARPILDAIAQTEQQIAQKKDEIQKLGSGGFDVTTGMKANIAYINDRNGRLKNLEKRKADLEKKLDDVQDEGSKGGADSACLR